MLFTICERGKSYLTSMFYNNRKATLCFDTGADVSTITTNILFGSVENIDELWDSLLASNKSDAVILADGSKVDSCYIVLNDVKIFNQIFPVTRFRVLRSDSTLGLLGNDVLRYIDYTHEYGVGIMISKIFMNEYLNSVQHNGKALVHYIHGRHESGTKSLFDTIGLVNKV